MYRGSILTVDDIKLDIFKNVNNFIFLSSLQSDQDSSNYIKSKNLIYSNKDYLKQN